MASQIRSIFTALAAVSVSVPDSKAYGTVTPAVRDLDALPDNVESAQLPLRVLLPIGGETDQNHQWQPVAFGDGPLALVDWKITDLLLWCMVDEGLGLESAAGDLVTYCGAYMDAMRNFRYPLASATGYPVLELAAPRLGVFQYPAGSSAAYFGVAFVLSVTEDLNG